MKVSFTIFHILPILVSNSDFTKIPGKFSFDLPKFNIDQRQANTRTTQPETTRRPPIAGTRRDQSISLDREALPTILSFQGGGEVSSNLSHARTRYEKCAASAWLEC